MEILTKILFILGLVLLNGYFVASEFALVAVRKTRISELIKKGNKSAELVQKALNDLDSYISATQLGITIASIGLGWIGEPALAQLIEPLFMGISSPPVAFISSHAVATAAAFSVITFLHIVLGELAPKTIALQRATIVSLFVIAPLIVFAKVFRPFIFILNGAGNLVLRIFGLHAPTSKGLVHSEEEIKMILSQSVAGGEIEKGEVEMVYKVFRLGDIPVQHIMVPRTHIATLNATSRINDALKKIASSTHSRFPVYEKSIDSIIGFIHIKDLYKHTLVSKENKPLRETNLVREIITIPETKRADDVLLEMRRKRIHIAIVQDENRRTQGLITLEDVIENIVGEIEDEFEKPLSFITHEKDGSFLIDGFVSIQVIQDKFNLPLKGQGYTTIGGLVSGLLGRPPKRGDQVQIANIVFQVEDVSNTRIKTVRLKKIPRKTQR